MNVGSDVDMEIDPDAIPLGELTTVALGGKEEGTIKVPGFTFVSMRGDTDELNIALSNPAGNPCYFKFDLLLVEDGEVLYTSGLVPPGSGVVKQVLSRSFSRGDYPVTIRVSTFSLENRTPMNGAEIKITLSVS